MLERSQWQCFIWFVTGWCKSYFPVVACPQDKMIAASSRPGIQDIGNHLGLPPPRSTLPSQPRWTNNDSCTPTCHKPYDALPLQTSYRSLLRQAKKHMQRHWSCRTCYSPATATVCWGQLREANFCQIWNLFGHFARFPTPSSTLFQNQRRKMRNPL